MRTLAKVVDDDKHSGGKKGRPVLYGFGYRYLLRVGRLSRIQTLAETIRRGIPLHEPGMVIAWGLARRGKRDLANAVLREFGYASKYKVERRSIMFLKT